MRAEHRHELKTNELALWLSNLPVWAKQNIRTITYVSAVVVIAAASLGYHWYQKTVLAEREQAAMTSLLSQLTQQKTQIAQAQMQGIDPAYMLLQSVDGLEGLAKNTKNSSVAALASIKEAEILRTELHFRLGAVSQQDFTNQINRAKETYTRALDVYLKKSPNSSLEAMAKFGLGLCEEDLGNFDKAQLLYNEIATSAAFEGTTSAIAAKQRLAIMNSFTQKIALKPMPKQTPPPQASPETQTPSPTPRIGPVREVNAPAVN